MSDIERSIDRLWEIRAAGEALPPSWDPPLDFAASLQVQLGILDRKLAAGEALAGWKIGRTSARVRERLGPEPLLVDELIRRKA